MAEAQGQIFADERIKTERLMAEEKSKVLWSFVFRSFFGFC